MGGIQPVAPQVRARGSPRRWFPSWFAILLVVTVGAAYSNTFRVPFLLDDVFAIVRNPSIRHVAAFSDVITPPADVPTAGRPLLNLSYALDYAAHGLSVGGYHAINLLIHISAALLLFGLIHRTLLVSKLRARYDGVALPLAGAVALLWALHPVQSESVTYTSQRAESLMGLFYLATLYCFARSVTSSVATRWQMTAWAACLCGMATKEVMATAPLCVLLYDAVFVSGSLRQSLRTHGWFYGAMAATWICIVPALSPATLVQRDVGLHRGVSWLTYAATEWHVIAKYLGLAFWPHPLVFNYGPEMLAPSVAAMLPYGLAIAVLLVGVALVWRRVPAAGYLGACFFLLLAPTSSVVPIASQPMAESRMYLPLAVVTSAAVFLGYSLLGRRVLVAVATIAIGFASLTFLRNVTYATERSIWEDTVASRPTNSRGQAMLSIVLARTPDGVPAAIVHAERAVALAPASAQAHFDLANALGQLPARRNEAVEQYKTVLQLAPGYPDADYNLANTLAQMPDRLPDAIVHYVEALRLDTENYSVHENLANAFFAEGQVDAAITQYKTAIALNPDEAVAHYNLGVALSVRPETAANAVLEFETALRLRPHYASAENNLAGVLTGMPGRAAEAILHYEAALRIDPNLPAAHLNLARLLIRTPSRLADGIAHYREALRLAPDLPGAHSDLGVALAIAGEQDQAIAEFREALQRDPNSAQAHYNLSLSLRAIGQIDEANREYAAAHRLNPALSH